MNIINDYNSGFTGIYTNNCEFINCTFNGKLGVEGNRVIRNVSCFTGRYTNNTFFENCIANAELNNIINSVPNYSNNLVKYKNNNIKNYLHSDFLYDNFKKINIDSDDTDITNKIFNS